MSRRPITHSGQRERAHDELRAGRAALLDLLADALLRELDEPLARTLSADPALAEALRPPSDEAGLGALRAEYARLFLLEAPPYASLFLDAPPVIGGETAQRWEARLAESGIPAPTLERAAARDHAGHYLRALASAERLGAPGPVLTEALRWLPQYLTALEQQDPKGFYGRLAQLAAYAIGESARHAETGTAASEPSPLTPPEDDRLRTLTRWLCTPLWSGWYLSPSRLRAFAHLFGSPPGRIERAQVLEQAFEASALDNRTDDLLDALLALSEQWSEAADAWSASVGAWSASLADWRARLEQTRTLLRAMREDARIHTPGASFGGEGDAEDEA